MASSSEDAIKGVLLWLCIGVGIWWWWSASRDDAARQSAMAIASTPDQLAAAFFNAKGADPRTRQEGDLLEITYNITPYSKGPMVNWEYQFLRDAHALIPEAFERHAASTKVMVGAWATVVDPEGHDATLPVLKIWFDREKSERMVWSKVDPHNLPQLAARYWKFGTLARDN